MTEKYVVKVYQIYPAWGMGQLAGAIICNDEDEANKIADEFEPGNVRAEVKKMTDDYENDLWKEWAEDTDILAKNYHYDVWGLNIITADEYREKGLEFVEPDFSDEVYSEEGEFLGWYDGSKDAVVDARGNVIGRYDDDGNFIRENESEREKEGGE